MFFILSKVFAFLVHPFSWILIFVFLGWIIKREKLKKWSYRLAIIFTLFFTNTVVFSEFARLWEEDGVQIKDVKHYDVAIVLTGMAEYDNNHKRLSIRRGADRLWQAMHLYHLKKVDKILISGSNGYLIEDELNEAEQFKQNLIDFGIPAADILVEDESKNTHQNATASKKLLEKYPELNSVLLVTSAMHMKRAKACFEKAGFKNFDTFTTDHYTGEIRGYSFDQYLIPNASNFIDWYRLIHEWIGYISYRISGYI
ncbi:YdcF family protein [Crocinitomix algicola]|uniref:YdcF family protein n=1 Tax=Crocinitomix algicola TaxID=1740263 RepID=UPI00082E0C11|nr:YdcF family protein [Crocinitomix algicola]